MMLRITNFGTNINNPGTIHRILSLAGEGSSELYLSSFLCVCIHIDLEDIGMYSMYM